MGRRSKDNYLHINRVDFRGCVTFADLAHQYAEHELVETTESIHPKAHTTIRAYERALRNRLLPRWGNRVALSVEPLEVEEWLKALKLEEELSNPTLDKTRVLCRSSTLRSAGGAVVCSPSRKEAWTSNWILE